MILENPFTEHIKQADLIIERGNQTFLCYLQRGAYPSHLIKENLPVWKIQLYEETTEGTDKVTRLLYPNGSDKYNFAPSQINEYDFNYLI